MLFYRNGDFFLSSIKNFYNLKGIFLRNEDLFEIPANTGIGWQQTYPKIPDKWMTQENKKSEGLFIPTIKILKRWRDIYCRQLRSFHLEMLTRMAFYHYNI